MVQVQLARARVRAGVRATEEAEVEWVARALGLSVTVFVLSAERESFTSEGLLATR
jgi:hypothetical protein